MQEHILRVAAVMHVAFHLESPHEIPKETSQKALEAAQDFVDMCCQRAAFMAGWGEIADVIQQLQTGLNNQSHTRDICAEKASHCPHTVGLHVVFESMHAHRDTQEYQSEKRIRRRHVKADRRRLCVSPLYVLWGRIESLYTSVEETLVYASPFFKTLR